MKFAHIEMEREDNPIKWDSLTQDDFNLVMRAKNVFEQCKAYSGRNVHEVNGAAGLILNYADNFLFSFSEKKLKSGAMDSLDSTYAKEGGWKEHCRKGLLNGIDRALKALKTV